MQDKKKHFLKVYLSNKAGTVETPNESITFFGVHDVMYTSSAIQFKYYEAGKNDPCFAVFFTSNIAGTTRSSAVNVISAGGDCKG